jgi:hypothetical protein
VEQKVDHRAKQGIEKDDVGYGLTVREVDWNEKRTKKKKNWTMKQPVGEPCFD